MAFKYLGHPFLGQQIPSLWSWLELLRSLPSTAGLGAGGADREEAGFSLSSGPCFFSWEEGCFGATNTEHITEAAFPHGADSYQIKGTLRLINSDLTYQESLIMGHLWNIPTVGAIHQIHRPHCGLYSTVSPLRNWWLLNTATKVTCLLQRPEFSFVQTSVSFAKV